MRVITATEASRRFSDLLDAVERGETVTITRGHHPVAEIGPARVRTGMDLRVALADTVAPDDSFADNNSDALARVTALDNYGLTIATPSVAEGATAVQHARLIATVRRAGTPGGSQTW